MIPRLLAWLRGVVRSSESEAADDSNTAADSEGRFAGSLLDLSVIVGHGGGNAEGERELESVAEEADRLSEARDR